MESLSPTFIISAFLAGIITFLAPCTLPLVPGYLSFISGSSIADLQDSQKAGKVRGKIFLNGVFYVTGFSAVFILFGMLFGLGGSFLFAYRDFLIQIGGAFIILFGIFLLVPAASGITNGRVNFMKYPPFSFLAAERQIYLGKKLTPGKPLSSLLFGGSFALGWSPCVGPILGVILTLAASSATLSQGAFLLFIFSFGLAVPFLLTALALEWSSIHFKQIAGSLNWVSLVGGIFLIFFGYMMITGDFAVLNSLIFRFLGSIGLGRYEESLLDSL
jgi:cytochrome c-type biogenesis protein